MEFFYFFSEGLALPPHYVKVLHSCGLACNVLVVIYGEGGLEMFLKPVAKCSGRMYRMYS